jgi:hypothetical protein
MNSNSHENFTKWQGRERGRALDRSYAKCAAQGNKGVVNVEVYDEDGKFFGYVTVRCDKHRGPSRDVLNYIQDQMNKFKGLNHYSKMRRSSKKSKRSSRKTSRKIRRRSSRR